ncbi:MAG: class I SAM-dependent methyltransferase [Acidiferrobacterales bacterium]|nr:class I SAM-dependent methyltransferase [Acidiferrobacterales bacterium]
MAIHKCHVCSADGLESTFSVNSYDLTTCLNCDHVQVSPVPDESELLSYYQDKGDDSFYGNSCSVSLYEQSESDDSFLKKYYSERIAVVERCTSSREAKILDFGCTNGVFAKAVLDSGYQNVVGYDVAEQLVALGRDKGLPLYSGDIDEFCEARKESFDFVLSYHVFEHLPSPKQTLAKLRSILKDGGRIYVNVPHIRSLQVKLLGEKSPIIDPPHHIHYFTRQSLIRLLQDQGFDILEVETPFWEKTTDTYLQLKGYNPRLAVALRHLVSPLRWLIKRFSLGGTLSIVAQKRAV